MYEIFRKVYPRKVGRGDKKKREDKREYLRRNYVENVSRRKRKEVRRNNEENLSD